MGLSGRAGFSLGRYGTGSLFLSIHPSSPGPGTWARCVGAANGHGHLASLRGARSSHTSGLPSPLALPWHPDVLNSESAPGSEHSPHLPIFLC